MLNKNKQLFLAFTVLLSFILVTLTFAQACNPELTWCAPSTSAPNPAGPTLPINTSGIGQTKTGWLNLGSDIATTDLQAGDLQASGLGLFFGGLGVEGGNFQIGVGEPAFGKVLMSSDNTGITEWAATSTLGLSNNWTLSGSNPKILSPNNTNTNVGIGTATPADRLEIVGGSIKLSDLAGSGNAYLCVDSSGTVFRGTSANCNTNSNNL